jgi:DMSO/TMAO reductase YedYZ molybdopterin-dependent catalytic subunit
MLIDNRKTKETEAKVAGRIPPGQSLTERFPVLHIGSPPRFNPATWDFYLRGLVETPKRFTWDEFSALPTITQTCDLHCVTSWSKLDTHWEGISIHEIMKHVTLKPEAQYVLVHADPGYTTNLPLPELLQPDVMLALKYDGQPLPLEHGYPVRLLVPRLYLWKSAKWVRGLEFMSHDKPGFWEQYGYHNYGDPWKEERYGNFVINTMQNVRSGR